MRGESALASQLLWWAKTKHRPLLTRWKQMEVELGLDFLRAHVDDDGMASIVTTGTSGTDIHLPTQDVGQFSCSRATASSARVIFVFFPGILIATHLSPRHPIVSQARR
jgi:hypothetical protein